MLVPPDAVGGADAWTYACCANISLATWVNQFWVELRDGNRGTTGWSFAMIDHRTMYRTYRTTIK